MNNLECLLEWKRTGLLDKDFHPALRYAMYRYAGDGDSSDGDATMVTVTKVVSTNVLCRTTCRDRP